MRGIVTSLTYRIKVFISLFMLGKEDPIAYRYSHVDSKGILYYNTLLCMVLNSLIFDQCTTLISPMHSTRIAYTQVLFALVGYTYSFIFSVGCFL